MTATTVQAPSAERAALARAVLARAEERTGARGQPRARVDGRHSRGLPVHPELDHLLPHGLERGTTLGVLGSTSLLLSLLAQASATGSWVAVAGLPHVGVLAAYELGMDLSRVVLVPDLGADGPRVLAALLDGVDVVVVGDVALADADRRRLSARAKERSAVLVATAPWPGAGVVLTAERSRWDGVGRGDGRLRTRVLTVSRHGRGAAARSWQGQVVLPLGPVGTQPTGRPGVVPDLAVGHGLVLELDGRRAG